MKTALIALTFVLAWPAFNGLAQPEDSRRTGTQRGAERLTQRDEPGRNDALRERDRSRARGPESIRGERFDRRNDLRPPGRGMGRDSQGPRFDGQSRQNDVCPNCKRPFGPYPRGPQMNPQWGRGPQSGPPAFRGDRNLPPGPRDGFGPPQRGGWQRGPGFQGERGPAFGPRQLQCPPDCPPARRQFSRPERGFRGPAPESRFDRKNERPRNSDNDRKRDREKDDDKKD